MKALILGAAVALAACSAVSAQPAKEPRHCISTRQIDRSLVVDDSTINLKVGKQIYQMKMAGPCPRLKNSFGGYILNLRGSDQICSPLDFQITINDGVGGFCNAKSLRPLTAAEVAALPAKANP